MQNNIDENFLKQRNTIIKNVKGIIDRLKELKTGKEFKLVYESGEGPFELDEKTSTNSLFYNDIKILIHALYDFFDIFTQEELSLIEEIFEELIDKPSPNYEHMIIDSINDIRDAISYARDPEYRSRLAAAGASEEETKRAAGNVVQGRSSSDI